MTLRLLAVEDTPTLLYGGQERSMFDVLSGLKKRGAAISLAIKSPGELSAVYEKLGIQVFQVEKRQLRPSSVLRHFSDLLHLFRLGRRQKWQLIYVNQYFDLPLFAVLGLLLRIPVVCHMRLEAPSYLSRQYRWALNSCAALIANSNFTRNDWIEAGLSPDIIQTVYNGFDFSVFASEEDSEKRVSDEMPHFLYAGRICREKGVELLLDAWILMNRTIPGRFTMVGPLRGADVPEDFAAQLHSRIPDQIKDRFTLLPARADIRSLFASADLFITRGLLKEAFGRTVIESLAMGTPVLVGNHGALPELLREFPEFVVPEDTPAAFAEKMIRFANIKQANDPQIDRLRTYVSEKFTMESYITGVASILDNCIVRR